MLVTASATHDETEERIEASYEIGNDLDEAVNLHDTATVFDCYRRAARKALKDFLDRMCRADDQGKCPASPAEIREAAKSWRLPGPSSRGAGKKKAVGRDEVVAYINSLEPSERAQFIKNYIKELQGVKS